VFEFTVLNFALAICHLPAIIWCSSAELAGDEASRLTFLCGQFDICAIVFAAPLRFVSG